MTGFLDSLLNIYMVIVIARAILSWFMHDEENSIIRFLAKLTDPVLQPIRRTLDHVLPLNGIDLSPIVVILIIELLRSMLH
jgi:YggT family protein